MNFLDVLIALSVGVLIGIAVGRRNSRDRARCQELETELAGVRAGANRYREEVAAHFSKTSDLVQGLTLQYRAVYDHLSDGARMLCPERTMELSQGDSARALLSASSERASGAAMPAPQATPEPAAPSAPADDALAMDEADDAFAEREPARGEPAPRAAV